jgi:hypothetical protein
VIGTLLGGVVFFVWGAVSWMVLPWHSATIKALPNETLLTDTMRTVVKEPGLYCFPHPGDDKAAWMDRVRKGPVGMIIFHPDGQEPMMTSALVTGFLVDLVLAALLMWILWASRLTKMVHQIHLTAAVGLVAGLAVCVPNMLFMNYPGGYTAVCVLDLLIAFALTGAAMGRFVPVASRS